MQPALAPEMVGANKKSAAWGQRLHNESAAAHGWCGCAQITETRPFRDAEGAEGAEGAEEFWLDPPPRSRAGRPVRRSSLGTRLLEVLASRAIRQASTPARKSRKQRHSGTQRVPRTAERAEEVFCLFVPAQRRLAAWSAAPGLCGFPVTRLGLGVYAPSPQSYRGWASEAHSTPKRRMSGAAGLILSMETPPCALCGPPRALRSESAGVASDT